MIKLLENVFIKYVYNVFNLVSFQYLVHIHVLFLALITAVCLCNRMIN